MRATAAILETTRMRLVMEARSIQSGTPGGATFTRTECDAGPHMNGAFRGCEVNLGLKASVCHVRCGKSCDHNRVLFWPMRRGFGSSSK